MMKACESVDEGSLFSKIAGVALLVAAILLLLGPVAVVTGIYAGQNYCYWAY